MSSLLVGQVAGWGLGSPIQTTIYASAVTCPVPTIYPVGAVAYMANEYQAADAYFLYDYSATASSVVNVLTDATGTALTTIPTVGSRFCWNGTVYDPIASAVAGSANYNVHPATSCTTAVLGVTGTQQTALVTQHTTGNPFVPTVELISPMAWAPDIPFVIARNNTMWMSGNYVAAGVKNRYWLNKTATNAQLRANGLAGQLP